MLSLPSSVRIYLLSGPTDMRKGFDGLAALVRAAGLDVFSGHLFVFVSRRSDRAKVLTFERGGFVLWYKRLELGRFRVPAAAQGVVLLSDTDHPRSGLKLRIPRGWPHRTGGPNVEEREAATVHG